MEISHAQKANQTFKLTEILFLCFRMDETMQMLRQHSRAEDKEQNKRVENAHPRSSTENRAKLLFNGQKKQKEI